MTTSATKPAARPVQQSLFADFDPSDSDLRQRYIADHPLMALSGGYKFPTSPVVFAFSQIVAGIATGMPGMAWVAYPRFGKSSATDFIRTHLGDSLENTPVVLHEAKTHVRADEGRFYTELLHASDFGVPPGRDVTERFIRLWKGWWALVASQKAKRIVLVVDEAQKLSVLEFSWLIDLANALAGKSVSLCVVLFGQPELVDLRNTLLVVGRMDIVGRFMLQVQNFEGIRSAIELEEVMGYLDDPEISEYPIGSGCSCTQFFVPHAYASGWRLKDHAAHLWAAFEQCAANAGDAALADGISVGMAWVRLAFVYVMQQLMLADDHMITIPSALWQDAADCSGFQESLGFSTRQRPADAAI